MAILKDSVRNNGSVCHDFGPGLTAISQFQVPVICSCVVLLVAVVFEPCGFSFVMWIVSPKCVFWPDNVWIFLRKRCDRLENFKKENTVKCSGYTLLEAVMSLALLAMIFGAEVGCYCLFSLLISWGFYRQLFFPPEELVVLVAGGPRSVWANLMTSIYRYWSRPSGSVDLLC